VHPVSAGEVEPDDLGPPGRRLFQGTGQFRRERAGQPERREGRTRYLDEFAPTEAVPRFVSICASWTG